MYDFLLWNTKEDILKIVDNQTVSGSIELHRIFVYVNCEKN